MQNDVWPCCYRSQCLCMKTTNLNKLYTTSFRDTFSQPRQIVPDGDINIQTFWYKPAGNDDDILRDVGHLFDGKVAHPPQGLLEEKKTV